MLRAETVRGARELIRHRDEDGCLCALRKAYDEYIAEATAAGHKWVPFERFELGIEIAAAAECPAPTDTTEENDS